MLYIECYVWCVEMCFNLKGGNLTSNMNTVLRTG